MRTLGRGEIRATVARQYWYTHTHTIGVGWGECEILPNTFTPTHSHMYMYCIRNCSRPTSMSWKLNVKGIKSCLYIHGTQVLLH